MSVSTFYPDPGPPDLGTTVDGRLLEGSLNTTFSIIRDKTTSSLAQDNGATAGGIIIENGGAVDNWQNFQRSVFLYDTSSLPDTDIIDSATHETYTTAVRDDFGSQVALSLVNCNPASDTSLVVADYNIAGAMGTTQQAADVAISTISASAYVAHTLNATGLSNINKTGISKFAQITSAERTDTSPTPFNGRSEVRCNFAEQAGTANDPKLVVTHTAVGAVAEPAIFLGCNF